MKFCQTNKNLLDKIKNENASLLEIKEFENNYKLIELCIYQLARGHYKYGLGNTPILVLKIYIALLTILAIGIFMLAFKK